MVLAGMSPPHEVGAEWWEWISEANAEEFRTLDSADRDRLIPEYERGVSQFATMTPESLAAMAGTPPADREGVLRPDGYGSALAEGIRRGASGPFGWFDDGVAESGPWGFEVSQIAVPVVIRHGELDHMVDVRHGRWLGGHIPGAVTQIVPDAAHGSIVDPMDLVVDTLLDAAG
jgi:pimeloyl-ACP methyl ester carboxylesterase